MKSSNRVRLICSTSASTRAKSGLTVRSAISALRYRQADIATDLLVVLALLIDDTQGVRDDLPPFGGRPRRIPGGHGGEGGDAPLELSRSGPDAGFEAAGVDPLEIHSPDGLLSRGVSQHPERDAKLRGVQPVSVEARGVLPGRIPSVVDGTTVVGEGAVELGTQEIGAEVVGRVAIVKRVEHDEDHVVIVELSIACRNRGSNSALHIFVLAAKSDVQSFVVVS